jgi:hypothetical protein
MTEIGSFEVLLRRALTPVEPPVDLSVRLENALTSLAEIAAEELEAWELSAMRDPRNWVRPAAAVVVGTTAGAALVILRARQRQRQHARLHGASVLEAAERAARDLSADARRLLRFG